MPGLHQCRHCGFKFEDQASLEDHEPNCLTLVD
jgi:C4-type Zn-finger protein